MPDMYKNGHMTQQLTPPAATTTVTSGTTARFALTPTVKTSPDRWQRWNV